MTLPSCDGIFEDIYDTPQKSQFGFTEIATSEKIGTIFVNASEYTRWIYMDFHHSTIDSLTIVNGGEEYTGEWDLAVHRWETKTNNGSAIETEFTDLNAFLSAAKMPEGKYVEDIETDSTIILDMSHMMEGEIVYAKGKINPLLSTWVNRDMSSMPPIYSMNNKVFVVKLKDGTSAALQLSNYMNDKYEKGFLTIKYVYPLAF